MDPLASTMDVTSAPVSPESDALLHIGPVHPRPHPHPRDPASNLFNKSCMEDGWYSLWRKDCGPTLYPSNKTPVTADVLEAGLLFATGIIAVSLFVLALGVRGRKTRWFFPVRAILALFVLSSILICNFGQEWEVSELYTKTPYRAGINEEIHAHVGVKIGLRSINVTLRADPEVVTFQDGLQEERINYNERYHWNSLGFDLGRNGFGPYAGLYNREFRASQFRGTPLPILWVSEYFTIDGEGIRWGRHYQMAGWYTHIMIWLAFPLWIVSMVLFYMVISYGAMFSLFTGLVLGSANLMWVFIRNPLDIDGVIPFEDGHMRFHYGWCFWLNLVTASLCSAIGLIFLLLDCFNIQAVATFLNKDIQGEYEDVYEEVPTGMDVDSIHEDSVDVNMVRSFSQVSAMSANSQLRQYLVCHYQRRRGTAGTIIGKFQKQGRRPTILRSAFSRDEGYTPDTPRPSFQLDPPPVRRSKVMGEDNKMVSWDDSTGIYDNVDLSAEFRERLMRQRSSAVTIYEEQEMNTMRDVVVEVEASPDSSVDDDNENMVTASTSNLLQCPPKHTPNTRPNGFPQNLQNGQPNGTKTPIDSQNSHPDSLPNSLPQSPTVETPRSPPPHTANLLDIPLFTNTRMGSTSSYLSAELHNSAEDVTRNPTSSGKVSLAPNDGKMAPNDGKMAPNEVTAESYPFSLLEEHKSTDGPKPLTEDQAESYPFSILEERGHTDGLKTGDDDILNSNASISQSQSSASSSSVQVHRL